MLDGSAFIGVSLDSNKFSRVWIRHAIEHVLARHHDLTLVLADRLLNYNKVVDWTSTPVSLDLTAAARRISQRTRDMRGFVESEVSRLDTEGRLRVRVASWDDYSDILYANLLRTLHIAYLAIGDFRRCVDYDAEIHFSNSKVGIQRNLLTALSAAYILDETAMDIRITELDRRKYDYYPVEQINTLRSIYSGEFSKQGLTVESLIGTLPCRVFGIIAAPASTSA